MPAPRIRATRAWTASARAVGTSSLAMRAATSSPFRPGSVMSSSMASGGVASHELEAPRGRRRFRRRPRRRGSVSSKARIPARTRAWSSASRMRRWGHDGGTGLPGPRASRASHRERDLDAAAGAGSRVRTRSCRRRCARARSCRAGRGARRASRAALSRPSGSKPTPSSSTTSRSASRLVAQRHADHAGPRVPQRVADRLLDQRGTRSC